MKPTYNKLAEQTDHCHRDGAGAGPQAPGVPESGDDPADVVSHVRARASLTATTITCCFFNGFCFKLNSVRPSLHNLTSSSQSHL